LRDTAPASSAWGRSIPTRSRYWPTTSGAQAAAHGSRWSSRGPPTRSSSPPRGAGSRSSSSAGSTSACGRTGSRLHRLRSDTLEEVADQHGCLRPIVVERHDVPAALEHVDLDVGRAEFLPENVEVCERRGVIVPAVEK